jgi:hypothetical protein
MNYPQSAYATGTLIGARPEKKVTETYFTMEFAIDTHSEYESDKTKVFQLSRSDKKNLYPLLAGFKAGDPIKVKYNTVCRKSQNGTWFTSLVPWAIEAYTPQTTSDFSDMPAQYDEVEKAIHSPAPNGDDDLPF